MNESVKKGKILTKIIFSDNVEWSSKKLSKRRSADAKANVKQEETKNRWLYLVLNLIGSTFKTCTLQYKKGMYFHLILVGIPYPAWYCTLAKNRGGYLLMVPNNMSCVQHPVIINRIYQYQYLSISIYQYQYLSIFIQFTSEILEYWFGVKQGQVYFMGRSCLFNPGWPPF